MLNENWQIELSCCMFIQSVDEIVMFINGKFCVENI